MTFQSQLRTKDSRRSTMIRLHTAASDNRVTTFVQCFCEGKFEFSDFITTDSATSHIIAFLPRFAGPPTTSLISINSNQGGWRLCEG